MSTPLKSGRMPAKVGRSAFEQPHRLPKSRRSALLKSFVRLPASETLQDSGLAAFGRGRERSDLLGSIAVGFGQRFGRPSEQQFAKFLPPYALHQLLSAADSLSLMGFEN